MRKVIFLFLMLLPLPLQAEISICKPKLAILYANGVWNSQDDARESFDNFYNKLYPILDKEHQKRIEYTGTLYNYNQGYMDDLLEVYTQKSGENYDAFWDWYLEVKTPPDWWVDFYNKMYHGPRYVRRIERANLSEQIETLMLLLSQNYRIFVVGHSQGNLFFNRNMQVLRHHGNSTGEKIATVAVATPADKIENGTKHFTFFEDKIIWGLGKSSKILPFGKPLPPNLHDHSKGDWAHHSFVTSYLQDSNSRNSIVSASKAEIEKLFPDQKPTSIDLSKYDPTCVRWFRNMNIQTEDPDECIMQCASAGVDMGTFTCGMLCDEFCGCNMQE